jgi:hypothetical protein
MEFCSLLKITNLHRKWNNGTMELFLLVLSFVFSPFIFVIVLALLGRFGSPYTAAALAIFLAYITLAITSHLTYLYKMEQTTWGLVLPILITLLIYLGSILLHHAKYAYDLSVVLLFSTAIGIPILIVIGFFIWLFVLGFNGNGF